MVTPIGLERVLYGLATPISHAFIPTSVVELLYASAAFYGCLGFLVLVTQYKLFRLQKFHIELPLKQFSGSVEVLATQYGMLLHLVLRS